MEPGRKIISGFSKWSAEKKLKWLSDEYGLTAQDLDLVRSHLHIDPTMQSGYNEFSENTISNFFIPYGLAPNFLINGKTYAIPIAIEESSVVAAASHAAKFWSNHGGFKAEVTGQKKIGQVHFNWNGHPGELLKVFERSKEKLIQTLSEITSSMKKRGGGISGMKIENLGDRLKGLFQIKVEFLTADAMGANFINTVLEKLASEWEEIIEQEVSEGNLKGSLEIIMSILSNYTPESIVKVSVEAPLDKLSVFSEDLDGPQFAEKFARAVDIARVDPYRAVTHNKGIFNGMDGVVIATGNDFRAVEACGHAYASRSGNYSSLSAANIKDDKFILELEVPMAIGTVGGLTNAHPLAAISLKILGNPSADELMMIIASAGLANNFSAVRALTTSGIQKGHMKMHLSNILKQLGATGTQAEEAKIYFKDKTVSHALVRDYLQKLKNGS